MKSAFQKFRYAATGRWAVSVRTYISIVFPFGYLTSIEREQQFNGISLSHAAGVALGGELACALYLFIAQARLLGNRKTRLQPLPLVIFVWVSTGVLRGFFTACNANWGSGYEYQFLQRIPVAAIYTTVAMGISAYYFGTIDRKRIETRALQSLENVLTQEQMGLSNIQRQRRNRALEVLDGQLIPQVEGLRSGIEGLLRDSQILDSSEPIDSVALEKLYGQSREISEALEIQVREYQTPASNGHNGIGGQTKFSYISAMLPKVLSIRITFLLLLIGSFSGQFSRNGIEGALAGFVGAIILIIYLLPISQALKKTSISRPLLYTMAYLGAFLLQMAYNLAQPRIGFVLNHPYEPWYSGLKTTYGVFLASVIATLIVSLEDTFTDLSVTGEMLRKRVNELSEENINLQSTIASTQFGTLQGKITGVTMALHLMSSMSSISQERRTELLTGANSLLNESLLEIANLKVGAL